MMKRLNREGYLTAMFLTIWLVPASAQLADQAEAQALEPDSGQLLDQVYQLEQSIVQLEQRSGAFDPRMGELSSTLASRLAELELHEAALESIQRADQNLKINLGLYAPEREPLLRMAFEQHIALRDVEAAQAELEHLVWLAARSLDAMDAQYIPRLLELARWHFSRYLTEMNDESLGQLEEATGYLEDAREIYQVNSLPYQMEFVDLYIAVNKAASEFLPAVQYSQSSGQSSRFDRDRIRLERLVGDVCDLGYSADEEQASRCERAGETQLRRRLQISSETNYYDSYDLDVNHTALFVNRAYQRVRQVLEEAYNDSLKFENPMLHVGSLLKTADWFLLYGHENNAREVYGVAAEMAKTMGVEEIFATDRPHPIPPQSVYSQLFDLAEQPASGSIRVRADIDADGKIESISFVNIEMEDSAEAGRVASQVIRTRFRPALANGQPVSFEGYEFNVHL